MDYRTKRTLGTWFAAALALLVWAFINGSAHAATLAPRAMSAAQLKVAFGPLDDACRGGHGNVDAVCAKRDAISTELERRGYASDPTVTVWFNAEDVQRVYAVLARYGACLDTDYCTQWTPQQVIQMMASDLVDAHIDPDVFAAVYSTHSQDIIVRFGAAGVLAARMVNNVRNAAAHGL